MKFIYNNISYITIDEVCSSLGIADQSVFKRIKEKKLEPPFRFPHRFFISEETYKNMKNMDKKSQRWNIIN